jgi:hypothetical protein
MIERYRLIEGTLANAASDKYEKAEGIVRQTRDRGEHLGTAEDYISFRPQYPNLQMRNSSTLWSHWQLRLCEGAWLTQLGAIRHR